ncbi:MULTISPECIES: hypothetical protein [Bartonella]|nr:MULTISPECIES: hypothetical protein [Bartonella]
MKLKFKQQEFQNDAVKSVIDLFKGQPQQHSSYDIGRIFNLLAGV